ncbi:MAG: magnesium transporter [Chloroflexota bacterium]|jgi:magnesium transporter|nr:magnesium transporter [Chloroflexota bacterium]
MTARLLCKHPAGVQEHPPTELSELRGRPAWLDVVKPDASELALIGDELGLHPLAVEDALDRRDRPKADGYDTYYFITFSALDSQSPGALRTEVFSIFAFKDVLVTVRSGDWPARAEVERRWREGRLASAGMLLHALLDTTVDGYFPIIDDYGERADVLEGLILQDTNGQALRTSLAELFLLKRDLLRVRKLIAPEREVLQVLSRGDVEIYGPEERRYFQDVYDHVVRVTDEIDTLRDLVSNVVDANLAAVSNRLNEVMKVLTALATILLVMTVVTGFFGQNFTAFIPYDSAAWFWGSIVFMAAAVLTLATYFRRKGWL